MALPKLPPTTGKPLKWLAACAVLVGGCEGLSTTTYHDKLANGLPTVCYGETEGVRMGDHYTEAECRDLLARKLERYWSEIKPFIHVETSDNEKIAYTSFAYNLGSGVFIRASFLKKLNAGFHKEACNGMLAYTHTRSAGYVKGLDRRRHKEVEVCEKIDQPGPAQRIIPLNPQPFNPDAPTPQPKAPKAVLVPPVPLPICTQFLFWKLCK
jgi:lysozyme